MTDTHAESIVDSTSWNMDEALSSCEQARQYYQSEDYELSLSLYTKGIQLLMQILEGS